MMDPFIVVIGCCLLVFIIFVSYSTGKDHQHLKMKEELRTIAKSSSTITVYTYCESKWGKYFL